jgi:hypothetical protein
MKQMLSRVGVFVAVLFVASCGGSGTTPAPAASACPPAGNLNFICGLDAPEDLVVVPGTRWMIASGMKAGSGLYLVDTSEKSAMPMGIAAPRPDTTRFAACPGPLDMTQAVLHGLSLRTIDDERHTMFATNHGGRESIEVFEVDTRGVAPSATWVGCVPMPDQLAANSVAAFKDGTLVATVLTLPGSTFEDLFAGRNTGIVLMWTPGTDGFRRLPGTELAGNNGIETSPDDREFYVASSGSKRIVAYSRADPSKPLRAAQLSEFAPDNVRMQNGRLITAGMIDDEPSCGGAPKTPEGIQCPRGYIAVSVDPQSMAMTEVARGPAAPPYSGTATALVVGNDLWLSSFNADRLAYRSLGR